MPVSVGAVVCRLDELEFGKIAYEVMGHVFAVHREFGRLLDEKVYQRELARRCGGMYEVPVEVVHRDFRKRYFLDLLVADGALFELKAVDLLIDRHRSQLLNYLLLTNLTHGKLVNLRSESVQHEFVNTTLTLQDRTSFAIDEASWTGPSRLKDAVTEMLRDLGAGLDIALYEEATLCLMNGNDDVSCSVPIISAGQQVGLHSLPFAAPDAPFQFSAMRAEDRPRYATHLSRFLAHTNLPNLHWINVTRDLVSFITIHRT